MRGKPAYKELKGEGTVSQQADEAWEYAHSRSNSVIQDIFAGQLQSTLECPACHAVSHTFDEFMDLSLPLPQKSGHSLRGGKTCTIQVGSVLCHAVPCCAVPCCAVLCCAMLCCAEKVCCLQLCKPGMLLSDQHRMKHDKHARHVCVWNGDPRQQSCYRLNEKQNIAFYIFEQEVMRAKQVLIWYSLQDCLDAFTETETLEEDEGYNCQSCKRKGVCATKKLTLYRCPPVLVLHLKRFNANNSALGIFSRFSAMSKVSTSS